MDVNLLLYEWKRSNIEIFSQIDEYDVDSFTFKNVNVLEIRKCINRKIVTFICQKENDAISFELRKVNFTVSRIPYNVCKCKYLKILNSGYYIILNCNNVIFVSFLEGTITYNDKKIYLKNK